MRFKMFISAILIIVHHWAFAAEGVIEGQVINKVNNEPVPYASIVIQGTNIGTTTDIDGNFVLDGLNPGLYNIQVSYVGFKSYTEFEVEVSHARKAIIRISLEEEAVSLEGVEIVASGFFKPDESPVSLRSLGVNEIKRAPGGNRDISRVVRSLPGVASTPSFRNDIIIRGGAPSENKYYLDGIEVPVINHFQTQGSSGGPVGLINVDFIKNVDFYSGAFPANRGNTLSSVFEFVQKDGRNDKQTFNAIVGASDLGITMEGPMGPRTTYIASVRRSYLQGLFTVLGLPFLPTYNDYQVKVKHKFNKKNEITIISLGALDDFKLNPGSVDKAKTEQERLQQLYLLNNLPVSDQWNYSIGAKYNYYRDNGFYTMVLSRNMLNTTSVKYANNDSSDPNNLIYEYRSQEMENKFRFEDFVQTSGNTRITYGVNYEFAKYFVDDYSQVVTQGGLVVRDFESALSLNKWGGFVQASHDFFGSRMTLSAGLRADANDYSDDMNNLWDQLSPRFSAAYKLTPRWSLNFNTGIYYQLPPYTSLGYRDSESNELVNKNNGLKYIRSNHIVAGLEYNPNTNTRITMEGFHKTYDQYPFHLQDSISLANLGADFGVIGNAPVSSISKGRSYGLELMAQQKLWKGFYGLVAYTWVRSEFTDKNNEYVPSSWDNRHLVSLTGGKKFKRDWEVGVRWLFSGGAPYTPANVQETVRRTNWDVRGRALEDYDRLNSERAGAFHQLDIRIDKHYYFNKWNLNLYFDIQNAYGHKTRLGDIIDVEKDSAGQPIVNPNNSEYYIPKIVEYASGTVLPTLGIIIEL